MTAPQNLEAIHVPAMTGQKPISIQTHRFVNFEWEDLLSRTFCRIRRADVESINLQKRWAWIRWSYAPRCLMEWTLPNVFLAAGGWMVVKADERSPD